MQADFEMHDICHLFSHYKVSDLAVVKALGIEIFSSQGELKGNAINEELDQS